IEAVLQELREENAKLRELFQQFQDTWTADNNRQHEELLETIRTTANERIPFNVQGYLDEFSKSLAAEVRMLLGEVGKLREEKRAIEHEMGMLLILRSKYGPGGEFEPDWKPPTPFAPQPQPEAGPPDAPPPPPEPARPAWRTLPTRGGRRTRKKSEVPPPGPVVEAQQLDPRVDPRFAQGQVPPRAGSWATWLRTVPVTLLAPEAPAVGLFGPRSPRDSQ
ncbi:hypothetical protein FA95DRAFT_1487620, partial [Auriscalpium vulgare]